MSLFSGRILILDQSRHEIQHFIYTSSFGRFSGEIYNTSPHFMVISIANHARINFLVTEKLQHSLQISRQLKLAQRIRVMFTEYASSYNLHEKSLIFCRL